MLNYYSKQRKAWQSRMVQTHSCLIMLRNKKWNTPDPIPETIPVEVEQEVIKVKTVRLPVQKGIYTKEGVVCSHQSAGSKLNNLLAQPRQLQQQYRRYQRNLYGIFQKLLKSRYEGRESVCFVHFVLVLGSDNFCQFTDSIYIIPQTNRDVHTYYF